MLSAEVKRSVLIGLSHAPCVQDVRLHRLIIALLLRWQRDDVNVYRPLRLAPPSRDKQRRKLQRSCHQSCEEINKK